MCLLFIGRVQLSSCKQLSMLASAVDSYQLLMHGLLPGGHEGPLPPPSPPCPPCPPPPSPTSPSTPAPPPIPAACPQGKLYASSSLPWMAACIHSQYTSTASARYKNSLARNEESTVITKCDKVNGWKKSKYKSSQFICQVTCWQSEDSLSMVLYDLRS